MALVPLSPDISARSPPPRTTSSGGQQVFFVGFAAGRGTLVLVHTLLHPVKQVFRNDSRNRIRHNDIPERQFSNVPAVLQHGVHTTVSHFAALHIADTLVVKEVYDFHHLLAVVIPLKGFQHQRRGQRVKVIKLVLVDFVADGSCAASAFPFQGVLGLTTDHLFRTALRNSIPPYLPKVFPPECPVSPRQWVP